MPDPINRGPRNLLILWSGELQGGLTQTLNGGYSAFRLLLQPFNPESKSDSAHLNGAELHLRKGQTILLRKRRAADDWFRGNCPVTVAQRERKAGESPDKTLLVKVVAIGFADGGEAQTLVWDGIRAELRAGDR